MLISFVSMKTLVTYTGIEREMQFEKYKERLTPFMDKIVHRVIDVRERNIGDWKTLNRNITPTGGRFIHVQRNFPRDGNGQCMDVIV